MNFNEVYSKVISQFPSIIDFSDGIVVAAKKSKSSSFFINTQQDSFYSQNLSQEYVRIKDAIGGEDVYITTMAWTIFQHLLNHCHSLFNKGITNIKKDNISMEEIKILFLKNIEETLEEDEFTEFKLE